MKKKKNSWGHWVVKNLLGMTGVYIVVILVAALSLGLFTRHGKEIKVPDFTGMNVPQAAALAKQNKLEVLVSDSVYVRRMAPGSIYRQNPTPGSGVKQGRKIRVVINAVSPKQVVMPNVVGYSLRQAISEVIGAGLQVGTLSYTNDFATNNVLAQSYRGESIEAGTPLESDSIIDLTLGVNAKENETTIPDVLGMHLLQATDQLHDNSLNVGKVFFERDIRTYADSLAAVIYRQVPDIGGDPVKMGGTVKLYFTLDPNKVPVRKTPEENAE
ncbi:MAG: PASTA domain-containing protein [Bacteroidales bacterium]|nr:PASTA domain-containing protein [Bacteroidales bacterium]